jgi:hypothetical protein
MTTTETNYRYEIWWCAAGCLPDSEHPAFVADTMPEIEAWLAGDEAAEYRDSTGDYNTYDFEIVDTLTEGDK